MLWVGMDGHRSLLMGVVTVVWDSGYGYKFEGNVGL